MKNKLYQKIFLILFLTVGFFALVSDARADYYAEGILQSKNILSNATVTAINSFQVTATVPANTTVSVKFSQDRVNYYSSAGVKDEWDSCANGTTNIDLSGLTWSGEVLFYKIKLTTTDELVTPVVGQVMVDYDGTEVPAVSSITYPPIGHLTSTDLLSGSGITLSGSDYFGYGISYLPYGTGISAQFSQDGITWYDSAGTMWGWDTLSFGDHSTPATALSLSALNWRGGTSFYYKLKIEIETLVDNAVTPIIAEAGLAMFSAEPILDLNFDEGQGPTAYDSSGNNNHGTLISGATGTNTTPTMMWDKGGKKGGAMEFDGTNDGIVFGDILDMGMNNFSISAWVKSTSTETGNANGIVYKRPTGESYSKGYRLNMPNGQFQFTIADGTNYKELLVGKSGQYNNNEWHHVGAIAERGSVMKVYIDGKLINSVVETNIGNIDSDVNFAVGMLSTSSFYYHPFDGLIDEVKIYNYALSEDEIKTLYNDSSAMVMGNDESRDNNGTEVTGANKDYCIPGDTAKCDKPVLELKMDEMTGTTAYDTSGNGNNGTLTNGPIWEPNGKIGSALKFDGVDDYAEKVSPINIPSLNSATTISLWAKANNATTLGTMVDLFDGSLLGNITLKLTPWGSGVLFNVAKYSDAELVTTSAVNEFSANNWIYYTYTFDGTTHRIYRNGIFDNSSTVVPNTGLPSKISIGRRGVGSTWDWSGLIDEVKIYNYARTPAQIAWDYNQGKPINHWTFDEGTGATVHDEGPNLNNGTITGATWKNESECKNGKCLYFDGLDTTRVDADTQDNMRELTACAWIKPKAWVNPGGDGGMFIFNKGFTLRLLNDGKIDFRHSTSGSHPYRTTNDSIVVDEWSRVCGVYRGVSVSPEVYVNGKNMPGTGGAGNGTEGDNSSSNLRIGAYPGNEWYGNFYGYIDDPKIYNYALTDEQIKMDYNEGAVNFK